MRRVLLIGAGHSHIEVIRRWSEEKIDDVVMTVVDPNLKPIYSGMAPGYIARQYERSDLEIDLVTLCRNANVEHVHDSVVAIDPAKGRATCAAAGTLDYHVASIDIGSSVAGMSLPGVAEFALPSRPIDPFLRKIDELARATTKDAGASILVVGGGAGGVEVAFCLDARLRELDGESTASRIGIVTPSASLLEGGAASARRTIERQAAQRGIAVYRNRKVRAIFSDRVEFDSGEALATSGVVWVTGPASIPAADGFDLPKDERGFFLVDSTFRIRGLANVFAVGDCASLDGMKKAGVYAVRAGPVIDANLRAMLGDTPLREYAPQSDFLSLLNLGNGEAVGTKWGVSLRGKMMMRLKDRIDRSFMQKYR